MKWIMRFLPLLLVVMLSSSCNRNPSSNPTPGGGTNGTPANISVSPITAIHNFRGETVSVNVTATVTDVRGVAVPGSRVAFTLTKRDSLVASISYAVLGVDSTDANGQISASLRVMLDRSENVTVTARSISNTTVYGTTLCQIYLLTDQVQSTTLSFGKNALLYRQGSADTTNVVALVADNNGTGISGLTIDFSIDSSHVYSNGVWSWTTNASTVIRLSSSTAMTDNSGEARITVWNAPNANADTVWFRAKIHTVTATLPSDKSTDSLVMSITPLTAPTDIFMRWVNPTDTLLDVQNGAVIEEKFVLWCEDSTHVRLPNVPVLLRIVPNGDGSPVIGSIPYYTTTSATGLDTITWTNNGASPGRVTISASIVQNPSLDKSHKGPIQSLLVPSSKLEENLPMSMRTSANMANLVQPQLLGLDEVNGRSTTISLRLRVPSTISQLFTRFRLRPALLYATGRDSLELNVTLRDQLNVGIPNATLTFATRHGFIPASGVTDASGSVRTYLKDLGGSDTTGFSGDLVYVRYPAMNLIDTARYYILPMDSLGRVVLTGPVEHVAVPTDTITFTATVFLGNNNYAYDSTNVRWFSYQPGATSANQIGIGHWQLPITKTVNGMTSNTFTMGTGTGFDSLVVTSTSPNLNDTKVAYMLFEHIPGPPVHLVLSPRVVPLIVNGPYQEVMAVVTDTSHNIVPYSPIIWGCTNGAGSISDDGHSITGDTAFARLTAGSSSGTFRYWGTTLNNATDTANFVVTASTPRTLALSAESQVIQVAGTGGNSNTILHAVVRDGNGNPVTGGTPVLFKITNKSQFTDTVAYQPYFDTPGLDSATSTTSGTGEAVATLTAGTRSGPVQIQAWVLVPDNPRTARDNITATLSNVQIVAGPPDKITVGVNNDNGSQEGGGTWAIWINATVRDRYSNPVADRYSVAFAVSPSSLAQVGLDTSATGNTGPNNQRLRGVAFTRMSYQGQNSFDTVTVRASAVSRDNNGNLITVFDTLRFALPLQQGTLQLNVTPNTFFFCRAVPPYFPAQIDVATHMVYATVRDGYGQPIHGCPVLFSVQRGKIYKTTTEAQNRTYTTGSYRQADNTQLIPGTTVYWPVNKRKTGNYTVPASPPMNWTDPNGVGCATVYIGALGPSFGFTGAGGPVGEVFLDPQTAETTSEVTAIVEGYAGVQSVRVVINYQRS